METFGAFIGIVCELFYARTDLLMELSKIAEESVRGSFFLVIGTAASTVIGAVASILVARLLGPSGYGQYSLAFVLPSLFVSFADFGLGAALTRYSASLRSQGRNLRLASMMGSAVFFNVVVSSIAFLLMFEFAGPLAATVLQRQNMKELVAVASIAIVFQGLVNISSSAFVGLDRMDQSALTTVVPDSVRVVFSPVLILVGFGVVGAVAGELSGWILAGLLGLWLLLVHKRTLRKADSTRETESGLGQDLQMMMNYGMALYLADLLATVLDQYQNIVLAFFTSNTEIGNFSVAANFGALVGIVSVPVMTALFPAFSKLDPQTRKKELQEMFQRSVKYTSLLILPTAIFIAALSRDLVQVVYGTNYSQAPTYLTLYAGIFLFATLGSYVISSFLSGIGRTREAAKIVIVQLAVFLPIAPVMAWLWRVPGVIAGLLLSVLISTCFGLWLAIHKYGMRVNLKDSLAALVTALASAVPILPLAWYSALPSLTNVLVCATIYLVAYLTLAPVLKAVKRTDIQTLELVFGQVRILRSAARMILAYEERVLVALERGRSEAA